MDNQYKIQPKKSATPEPNPDYKIDLDEFEKHFEENIVRLNKIYKAYRAQFIRDMQNFQEADILAE